MEGKSMKKYMVDIINHPSKGAELLEHWEMNRERITRQDFRDLIISMFYYACDSYEFSTLTAKIKCEDRIMLEVKCVTRTDGSEIYSDIFTARPEDREFSHVRRMQVAA